MTQGQQTPSPERASPKRSTAQRSSANRVALWAGILGLSLSVSGCIVLPHGHGGRHHHRGFDRPHGSATVVITPRLGERHDHGGYAPRRGH